MRARGGGGETDRGKKKTIEEKPPLTPRLPLLSSFLRHHHFLLPLSFLVLIRFEISLFITREPLTHQLLQQETQHTVGTQIYRLNLLILDGEKDGGKGTTERA